jgi:5-bromo-4-chloroindolyl phosphate hydrolysis protein
MLLKDIKEMLECDVLGNDKKYIEAIDFTDKDWYNIRRMAERARYNVTENYWISLATICAMFIYCTQKGLTEKRELSYLREDLEDAVETYLQVMYDEAFEEYRKIKGEEEENDE